MIERILRRRETSLDSIQSARSKGGDMSPLAFEPILKRIRWGGRQLADLLGKEIGPEADYAESWEIADHGNDQSIVASGASAGRSLRELVEQSNEELLGRHAGLTQFPLLIKYLDANDWLSLQVHPNDEQAKQFDPTENGKTEAWVILAANPNSRICAGLKSGIDREQFASHLQAGTIEECLNMFEVEAGDCVFVPAGTVHAIGEGVVLAEVQQQSNLTFRLHDWGRMGTDGQPRQIHIEESLSCTDFNRGPVGPVTPRLISDGDHKHEELVRCQYFVIGRHQTKHEFAVANGHQFRILMFLEGSARVDGHEDSLAVERGSTVLIPASADRTTVVPDGDVTVLEVFLP